MTKDVLVTVKGLQSIEAGEPEEVEMVSRGDYYYKNGHHYIFFDEVVEGFTESTRNSIKVSDNSVEVKKKGLTNVQMIFEENKNSIHLAPYKPHPMMVEKAKQHMATAVKTDIQFP